MKIPWISEYSNKNTSSGKQPHLVLVEKDEDPPSVWFFGYGSLIWNPGVQYSGWKRGRLDGFSRVFWQGNMTYRGDPKLPGRVVTITENQHDHTYGILFKVTGRSAIQQAYRHLDRREIDSGYEYRTVTVTCIDEGSLTNMQIQAVTCVATPDNQWFLGPTESTEEMARQIATARGKAGPNSEYLLNLALYIRKLFPKAVDSHLFELEHHVLQLIPTPA